MKKDVFSIEYFNKAVYIEKQALDSHMWCII